MSRYKGRQSAKHVEREFPHFVDVVVPPGDLGTKLDGMYDFHVLYGVAPKPSLTSMSVGSTIVCRELFACCAKQAAND